MTHYKPCPECEGRGTMTYERVYTQDFSRDIGFIDEYEETCSNCGGDGQIEDDEYEEDE